MKHHMEVKRRASKRRYRVRNWPAYNAALIQRGSLDIWLDEATLGVWRAAPSHSQGAPRIYSDAAIAAALTIKSLFRLPLRNLQGFLKSTFRCHGVVLPVPHYSTCSRRSENLPVRLTKRPKEKTILVLDATGVKVYGEGEWKVRQHGYAKRRTWKKIHIGISEDGEIRATAITSNAVHDADVAPAILDQEEARITAFIGDGIFDRRKVYDACRARGITDIRIPPRQDAKIWRHGNWSTPSHPRDDNLRAIRRQGRKQWKEHIGYHVRSLVETTMFRFKTIFGDRVSARVYARQVTELTLRCNALNRMFNLGMPDSYAVR